MPAITKNAVYLIALLAIALSAPMTVGGTDAPLITADPNPAPLISSADSGETTITWNAHAPDAEIVLSVNGSPEQLFTRGSQGKKVAPWIRTGVYEFRLYEDKSHRRLLGAVKVTGDVIPDRSARPVGLFRHTARGYGVLIATLVFALTAILALAFLPRRKTTDGAALQAPGVGRRLVTLAAPLIVLAIAAGLSVYNLCWLERFRGEFPLDIDESQFIVAGFDQASALENDGLEGFWEEFESERWHGPLQPFVTGLLTLALGRDIFLGFVVCQLFYVFLIFVTYGIGKHLGGPWVGVLSALAVGTAPGVIYASRVLFCTIPSTALLIAATYALLKSRKLDCLAWTVIFGLTVGLANLSRPLAIFLAPGLFAAAAFQIISVSRERRRRTVHWLLSGLIAFGVSEIWYWRNFDHVWHYLTDYGFGRASMFEGEGTPPVIIGFLTYRIRTILNQGLQLPLALVLAAIGLTGLTLILRRLRGEGGWRMAWQAMAESEFSVVAIVAASIYATLSLSRNEGDGFMIFVVPLIIVMSVTLAWKARRSWLSSAAIVLLVLAAAFNTLLMADVNDSLSTRRTANIPWMGYVFTIDGWGRTQSLASQAGYQCPPTIIPPALRDWCVVNDEILECVAKHTGGHLDNTYILFCLRDPLLNFATLKMFNRIHFASQAIVCVEDAPQDDTLSAYKTIFAEYAKAKRVYFVSAPTGPNEYGPIFNQQLAEQTARAVSYEVIQSILLPDSRVLRIWEKKKSK